MKCYEQFEKNCELFSNLSFTLQSYISFLLYLTLFKNVTFYSALLKMSHCSLSKTNEIYLVTKSVSEIATDLQKTMEGDISSTAIALTLIIFPQYFFH